jgi:phosphatidylglycerol:prolipoprotein diacylglycerol transferase
MYCDAPVALRRLYALAIMAGCHCFSLAAALLSVHPVLFQFGAFILPTYGACVAVGVLLALASARFTSPRAGIDARHAWNMLILGVFAALAGSRLFLIAMNLGNLRQHPRWLLAISMIHHPLLAAIGIVCGAAAILMYIRTLHLSIALTADGLTVPLSLALAAEQLGAWMAGSDFGIESLHASPLLAVTYSNELAARWSGTPLGVPLYPVQLYAAAGALLLAAMAYCWLLIPHRAGDVAGAWLIGLGIQLFVTEGFRDWEGRGVLFHGAIDTPQLAAVAFVLSGGLALLQLRAWTGDTAVTHLSANRPAHRPGGEAR